MRQAQKHTKNTLNSFSMLACNSVLRSDLTNMVAVSCKDVSKKAEKSRN